MLKQPLKVWSVGAQLAQKRDESVALQNAKVLNDALSAALRIRQPGGARRSAIMRYLASGERLPVNNKYQLNVAKDADIRRLLKEKQVRLIRCGERGTREGGYPVSDKWPGQKKNDIYRKSGKHQSYLVIAR